MSRRPWGTRRATAVEGQRELAELAAETDRDRDGDVTLLEYFWRHGLRLVALWPTSNPAPCRTPRLCRRPRTRDARGEDRWDCSRTVMTTPCAG